VCAECVKTLLRLKNDSDVYLDISKNMLNWLVNRQNTDGSWNEVHVNYNKPSSLVTSIVGDAIIDGYVHFKNDELAESAKNAMNFVLTNEVDDGYFQKSTLYRADHLNVDATCGAFLSKYGLVFSDVSCSDAAQRVVRHIFDYQNKDGSFPYTVNDRGHYDKPLEVPCIHYQAVTIYFIIQILDSLNTDLQYYDELNQAISWLDGVLGKDGRFDWSKSGLMFSYYLSGAYAFTIPCFFMIKKRLIHI